MPAEDAKTPWLGLMTGAFAVGHSMLDGWARAFGAFERPETRTAQAPLRWRAARHVVGELPTMRLRAGAVSPTRKDGPPLLVVAPFAVHSAQIADFAPGHSVVEVLARRHGARVVVTDWRSATPPMRDFGIDQYLSDLHVAISDLGGLVDVVGLCQGGWLALAYAARFPGRVRRLALAGTPVDVSAGKSTLSKIADDVPGELYDELIHLGEGRLRGDVLLSLWSLAAPDRAQVLATLQRPDGEDRWTRALVERFSRWHGDFVDLPGRYYAQTVHWIFKENRLAGGRFVALGRVISLADITMPLFILTATRDQVTHPAQALALREIGRAHV